MEGAFQACLEKDNIQLHEVLFHSAGHYPRWRESHSENDFHNKALLPLAELLRAGCYVQAWHVEDPDMTAVFLYHAFHGVLDHVVYGGGRWDKKALIRSAQDFFRQVVQPQ